MILTGLFLRDRFESHLHTVSVPELTNRRLNARSMSAGDEEKRGHCQRTLILARPGRPSFVGSILRRSIFLHYAFYRWTAESGNLIRR